MLHLFDLDDTLIVSFLREAGRRGEGERKRVGDTALYDTVQVLPGRRERLHELRNDGHRIGIVTNQGGVAFGYQTEPQVRAKLDRSLAMLGLPSNTPRYVSLMHPHAKLDQYRGDDGRRKPKPGMLLEACRDHVTYPFQAMYVGDLPSDEEAARAAGMPFQWAEAFFARVKQGVGE